MVPLQARTVRPVRDRVFVSYSHRDREWLERLRQILAPDVRNDRIDYWDDAELAPGDPWYAQILHGIDRARVAILLVSPDFLASRFIMDEEVPRILQAAEDGLTVLWVPLSGTFYGPEAMQGVAILTRLQAAFDPTEPLAQLPPDSQIPRLRDLCRRIEKLLNPGRVPMKLPFPTLGNLFKGREQELKQLDEQLRSHGSSAIIQPQAVSGLGGIGKTRLALEYAWRHANDFKALLFVSANTPADLETNLATLSASDALDLREQEGKQDEQYNAVIRWMQQNKGWLLILDNVDTREGVAAVQKLVAQVSGGHILITSRYTRWGEGIQRLPLDVIPLPDAVALLLEKTHSQRQPRPEDQREAEELAGRLGCLPLALTHAAAYVAEYDLGFSAYLSEFDRALQYFDHEVIKYETDPDKAGIVKTVSTTFFITFDRLDALEKAVLCAASFLAPAPIPVAMFEESPEEVKALVQLWCEEKGDQPTERSIRDALAELARFSLVMRGEGAVSMHRMEQLVLRSSVPKDRVPKWIDAARAVLVHYAPDETAEDPKTWPVWDRLRAHAEALVAFSDTDSRVQPHLALMEALGQLYYGKGNFAQSLSIDESLLSVAQKIYPADSGDLAHRFLSYGESLHQLGRNAEAEAAFRKSLAIREVSDGPGSLKVAEDLNYLAMAVAEQGQQSEAEALHRRAVEIFEAHIDEADKGSFAKSLNNLGNLVWAKGQMDEAEALKRRAVEFAEEGFGPDNPKTLICVATLAALLEARGNSAAAEPLLQRAADSCEKSLGLDHPTTLQIMMNYANCLGRRGEIAKAEQSYRHLLAAYVRLQGKDGNDTLIALNNLGWALQAGGHLPEAEEYFRRGLEIREKVSGPQNPQTLNLVHNLAMLLQAKGDLSEAEALFRRETMGKEHMLGKEHPDTLSAMASLVDVLRKNGREDEATSLRQEYMRRVADNEVNLPPLTLRQVALESYRNQDYARAEKLYRRLLNAGFEVADAHLHLVRVFLATGRDSEARAELTLAEQDLAETKPYVAQRIGYFHVLLGFLNGDSPTEALRVLKQELARPDVFMEWDLQALLEQVKPRLTAEAYELLDTIAAVINDRALMERLNALPLWPT